MKTFKTTEIIPDFIEEDFKHKVFVIVLLSKISPNRTQKLFNIVVKSSNPNYYIVGRYVPDCDADRYLYSHSNRLLTCWADICNKGSTIMDLIHNWESNLCIRSNPWEMQVYITETHAELNELVNEIFYGIIDTIAMQKVYNEILEQTNVKFQK